MKCSKRWCKVDDELPKIVCGLLGISTYARMASKGGTYCPVCIWLTFRSRVPGCYESVRWVRRSVLSGFQCRRLMLQDLAHWALWVQMQDKSRPRHGQTSKVSPSILHHGSTKSTLPPTCPPDMGYQTPTVTMGKTHSHAPASGW